MDTVLQEESAMQIMQITGAKRLYELFDSLVALRLKFADGTEGSAALELLGRAKVHEVRAMLDAAIENARRIIGSVKRPNPSQEQT
jgi:hypothetical protein